MWCDANTMRVAPQPVHIGQNISARTFQKAGLSRDLNRLTRITHCNRPIAVKTETIRRTARRLATQTRSLIPGTGHSLLTRPHPSLLNSPLEVGFYENTLHLAISTLLADDGRNPSHCATA